MTGTVPSVSVVVPTHGRPGQIRRCVDSLMRLDYPGTSLQIVVVDDGGPRPMLDGLDVGPDLRVIPQHNLGPAAARNRGAREAEGEILAFTDDDCRPRPDWLRQFVRALAEEPAAMVGGRTLNGLEQNIWAQASQELISFLYDAFATSHSLRPFFTTNNLAVAREKFLDIGGFDEGFPLPAAEDRDLSERWAVNVGPLRYVKDAVVDHFHSLDAWSFIRQHHGYGRGAVQLAERRQARGHGVPAPEPITFYARMVAYPYRRNPGPRGLVASGLVAGSQLIGLTGMAREALRLLLARGRARISESRSATGGSGA